MARNAQKQHRQNERRRLRNKMVQSRVRTQVRRFMESLEDGNAADAENEYTRAQKLIDSAERKGVLPKNRAARQKSRLMKRLNEIRG